MTGNSYNVLWVDDEISAILDDFTKEYLSQKGIHVIDTATQFSGPEGLEALLRKYVDSSDVLQHIDAVITDANFNAREGAPINSSERDTSGLNMVASLIPKYSEKNILFYLYTGRDSKILRDIYVGGELDVFKDNDRWFQKTSGPKPLVDAIKRDVDKLNSTEFRIRNNYRKDFEAAALIPGASELLAKGLSLKNSEQTELAAMFNGARMVFEHMRDLLRQREFIPDMKSLNDVPRFFNGIEVEPYKPEENSKKIMPKTLSCALDFFLRIVQDGSHNTNKLGLCVTDYVNKSQSSNLFFSIMHILMDLLRWYANLPDDPKLKHQWVGHYEEISIVSVSESGRLHTKSDCELYKCDELKPGMIVGIKVMSEHKSKTDGLKFFARREQYDILDRKEACISNVAIEFK